MTIPEFLGWREFFKRHPFDDEHRYHRPAAFVGRQMTGFDFDDAVTLLRDGVSAAPAGSRYSEADLATFKAFGRKPPQLPISEG